MCLANQLMLLVPSKLSWMIYMSLLFFLVAALAYSAMGLLTRGSLFFDTSVYSS